MQTQKDKTPRYNGARHGDQEDVRQQKVREIRIDVNARFQDQKITQMRTNVRVFVM